MFFYRRHFGLRVCDIWFEIPQAEETKKCVVYSYNCMNKPYIEKERQYLIEKRDALTLINDLTTTEESIFGNFASTVRNEIYRADREGVLCKWWDISDIRRNKDIIRELDQEYLAMYRAKGIPMSSISEYINHLVKKGVVAISTASFFDDEKSVAFHVYLVSNNVARLMYSVTPFRKIEDKCIRNSISRANRKLHWEDMRYLKKNGYSYYDWGGYSKDEALNGINAFKKGFGGTIEERFFYKVTPFRAVKIFSEFR